MVLARFWQRSGLVATLVLALPACTPANPAAGGTPASTSRLSLRQKGQAQNTQIQVQRFKNLLFRNKSDGAILNPQTAAGLPQDQVLLETGDWDELHYERGRLRYTGHPKEKAAQPVVVERLLAEADFEALDLALWTDPFFTSEQKNWDANTRLPMYYVRYQQNGKGHEASFAPSLGPLSRTSRLVEGYLRQLSGEAIPPVGVTHILYAIALKQGRCEVRVSQLKAAGADAEESPLPLQSVKVDTGSGFADATMADKGFSFAAPTTSGEVAVSVQVQPKEGEGWSLILPVRVP